MAFNFGDKLWSAGNYRNRGGGPYSTNPWSAIIDVKRGNAAATYNAMPPLGGHSSAHPARVINASTGQEVEIYYQNGRKKLRRIKKPTTEKRQLTREEALDNPDKMYLYLKQYNKRKDKEWEKEMLESLDDGEDMAGGVPAAAT